MSTTSRQSPNSQNVGSDLVIESITLWMLFVLCVFISTTLLEVGLIFIGTGVGILAIIALAVIFLRYLG